MDEERPELASTLTEAELLRWYWTKAELVAFARELGLGSGGSKRELTTRIGDRLSGRPARSTTASSRGPQQPESRHRGPLSRETVLPPGQRCTQELRAFLTAEIGPSFRFDAAMRDFVARGTGATLGDAVAHWHATRHLGPQEIGEQFELNRFTRQWYADHPDGSRGQLQEAWRTYRSLPSDARPMA